MLRTIVSACGSIALDFLLRLRVQLAWILYIVAATVCCTVLWYPPIAIPVRLDTNDMSPGLPNPTMHLSFTSGDPISRRGEVRVQRSRKTDGSEALVICVPKSLSGGITNHGSLAIADAFTGFDSQRLSRDLVILMPDNLTTAQLDVERYLERHAQETFAAIVLLDDLEIYDSQVVIDSVGNKRPNLDMVGSLLKNCFFGTLDCKLKYDHAIPSWSVGKQDLDGLHVLFNSHRVGAVTVRFNPNVGYGYFLQKVCQLIERQVRCLSNLYEPLHDATFSYLVSPYRDQYNDGYVIPSSRYLPLFAMFPLSLLCISIDDLYPAKMQTVTGLLEVSLITMALLLFQTVQPPSVEHLSPLSNAWPDGSFTCYWRPLLTVLVAAALYWEASRRRRASLPVTPVRIILASCLVASMFTDPYTYFTAALITVPCGLLMKHRLISPVTMATALVSVFVVASIEYPRLSHGNAMVFTMLSSIVGISLTNATQRTHQS